MSQRSSSFSARPAADREPFGLDDGQLEQLAACIGDFVAAWEQAEKLGPPDISSFLPEPPTLRRQTLIELIKVDLECRWNVFHLPKRLHEYVEEFPELWDASLPAELAYEEFQQRQQAGESVSLAEYCTEFPECADQLEQLAALGPPSAANSGPPIGHSLEWIVAGERIADLDLLMLLGQGAFARVFLARDRAMNRLVALKVSVDHGSEGQTLAQLDHDYVVRVFHQQSLPDRQLRVLSMQYLPGGTLHAVVRRVKETPPGQRSGQLLLDVIDKALEDRGENRPSESSLRSQLARMGWPEVVAWIGMRLAEGLAYAHGHGVLHRDIKPANVLLTAEGVPKLADFNISFSCQAEEANPSAYFGGSLDYMSPEHLEACQPGHNYRPEDLDERTDVYSLGVMLWELLTGGLPFEDASEHILTGTKKRITEPRKGFGRGSAGDVSAEVPAALIFGLQKCLAADRDQRWRSAQEIASQLRLVLQPRARELIVPPANSWAPGLCRAAVLVVLAMILIANGVAARLNYLFNHGLLEKILPAESLARFDFIVGFINGIAFPVGAGLVAFLAWRIRRHVLDPDHLPTAEDTKDSLLLGHRCAMICLGLWGIAGIAYPVTLDLTGAHIPQNVYWLFLGSLIIFGLIATVYPFFGVTWFASRYLYPGLLRKRLDGQRDHESLRNLQFKLRIYLWLAASIPLLAISAVTVVGAEHLGLIRTLCLGGTAAFAAAYWFQREIEEDLNALSRVVRDAT